MIPFRRSVHALCALAMALGLAVPAAPQSTTGTLSVDVADEQGGVLPGATVVAVHEPTGTRYEGVTNTEGLFVFHNVRVGGPYTVTVTLGGFRDQGKSTTVRLGEESNLDFGLQIASVTETVEVTAEAADIINPTNTGPSSNVSQEAIENLPTVNRSLDDFARTNPYFASTPIGGTTSNALSVAGRNNRYNSIQIDGAVNNDLFGLAASGAPGGQADTQPISLDAISEIQLLVAPYDVRHGGFSGGGLNAVTRSGTNTFGGTAYYFTRNQDFVGNGPDDREFGTFDDDQFGASVGGPIKKDKVFFFVNGEMQRRQTPNGFSVGGTGQNFGHVAEVTRFREILRTRYNYDPGSFTEEFIRNSDNNKIFGRLDFNLSPRHQLTLRHNFIDGVNDIYGTGNSSTRFNFPDSPYQFNSNTHSTVAQLNSTFGRGFNELRLTFQRIRENRGHVTDFPMVTVRLPDGANIVAGTEQFSAANRLDQDILEITDDFTFTRGEHTFTIGTHNELFQFSNLFIRDNFGSYQFSSLDNLEAGIAQQYDYSFSVTGIRDQAADFKVNQLGLYAGDVWRVTPAVTLTLGMRVDKPFFPDKPTRNEVSETNFGFRTDVAPNPTLFSPRAGFNWDIGREGKRQLRGGAGIFAGRTPYVWLSNQYGNTGNEFQRIGASFNANNRIPFVADPRNQPTTVTGANAGTFTNEIDIVDPDYDYPRVLRGSLAYDHELGGGMIGTIEFLGGKTLKDIDYDNLNRVPGSATLFDGRPIFVRRVNSLSDVVFLTNTDEGSQWSVNLKLERPFRNGLYYMGSYIYGRAKSINDGTSSQALSNWRFVYVPGDINDPPLAYSNFDVRHRISAAVSWEWQAAKRLGTLFSLYFNSQSGRPYSTLFNTDVNADGTIGNDLLYVPNDVSEVIVRGGTPQQLEDYIAGDEGLDSHRGQIIPRNASRLPWTNTLDFRASANVPFGRRSVELTMDVLNLLNLIDSSKGRIQFLANQSTTPIRFEGIDAASGKPIYNIATITAPTFTRFITDDLRSRWQAQFGVRVRF